MARLTTPSRYSFQFLQRFQDPSQDLTWLLFGHNPKSKVWDHTSTYDRHPLLESLVKRADIMRSDLQLLDTTTWTLEDKSCVAAFYMYLGLILKRQHPTAPLVAHAFLKGLDFRPFAKGNDWAKPAYTDIEQLWSAATDAFTGIEAFLMQHGFNAAVHDEPSDFQQAPTTSHSTQMLVRATLEECNTTATFQFQLRCASKVVSASCVWGVALQVAMESVASKQSVNDWNVATLNRHFAKVCSNTPDEYCPFWMHPDIQQHYRIQLRCYDVDKWSFSPGGFRFNPRNGENDPFSVFVQSLGDYFIVVEKARCDDAKCDTEAIWKISGQRLGSLWTPTGKERLTATPFGGASRIWLLRLLQELWLQCPCCCYCSCYCYCYCYCYC